MLPSGLVTLTVMRNASPLAVRVQHQSGVTKIDLSFFAGLPLRLAAPRRTFFGGLYQLVVWEKIAE